MNYTHEAWFRYYMKHYPKFREEASRIQKDISNEHNDYRHIGISKNKSKLDEAIDASIKSIDKSEYVITSEQILGRPEYKAEYYPYVFVKLTQFELSLLVLRLEPSEFRHMKDDDRNIWTALQMAKLATTQHLVSEKIITRTTMVHSLWDRARSV